MECKYRVKSQRRQPFSQISRLVILEGRPVVVTCFSHSTTEGFPAIMAEWFGINWQNRWHALQATEEIVIWQSTHGTKSLLGSGVS